MREQDALREQLEQLALKRQEMAVQAKVARRALQIAKAKVFKTQKVLNKLQVRASMYQKPNEDDRGTKSGPPVDDTGFREREEVIKEKAATAFAAQRREINEHLGQADAKPTEGATEQTS
ncbi:hypothetical protein Plhal304r1_c031g0101621 [Plasmopara halstedii]